MLRSFLSLGMVLLLLLSLGDVFCCGLETDSDGLPALATELTVAPQSGHHGGTQDQAPCLHGHCHHVTPMQALALYATWQPQRIALQPAAAERPVAMLEPSTIDRPPRA